MAVYLASATVVTIEPMWSYMTDGFELAKLKISGFGAASVS